MDKTLLSKDYENIVFQTFAKQQSDCLNYYSNIFKEYYKSNPAMFQELEIVINRCIEEHNHSLTELGINENIETVLLQKQLKAINIFSTAKKYFISFLEVLITDHFPHLTEIVENQKSNLEYSFINRCINTQSIDIDTGLNVIPQIIIDELIKELEVIELTHLNNFENIPASKINEASKGLDELISICKKDLIIHGIKHKEKNDSNKRFIKSRIKYLEIVKNNIEQKREITKKCSGLKSSLTDGQIQSLFDKLKGSYIDINTNPDHFKAVFKSDPLPDGFNPVKWILGKNALRELLTFISGYVGKTNKANIPDEIIERVIPELFKDKKDKGIKLNKPKKTEYSKYYLDIEGLIKGL